MAARDPDDERPIRILVFPDRPDVLLVTVPEGQELWLPRLPTPFERDAVARALMDVEVKARVGESVPGRYKEALAKMDRDSKEFDAAKQRVADAVRHVTITASPGATTAEKQRSELAGSKHEIDAEIRQLKVDISNAKSAAYRKKHFLPPVKFRAMEARLANLQTMSIAVQEKLRVLKQQAHAARNAGETSRGERFLEAAKKVLSKEQYLQVWAIVDQETEDP